MKRKIPLFSLLLLSIFLWPCLSAYSLETGETDPITEEYRPHFSSLKILPPDDLGVEFDYYKARWRPMVGKALWKENLVHPGQVTRLDLPPGKYEMHLQLFHKDKLVAGSEVGKCAKLEKTFDLGPGEMSVEIPVCTGAGGFGVSENKLFLEPPQERLKLVKAPPPELRDPSEDQTSLSVLLFGDSGTGEKEQYKVAQGMQDFCENERCDFALMLGDNIYSKGATSVDDRQFETKFEKPYAGLGMNFYVALGNHDTYSGSKGTEAQILYSQKSQFWNMPARYYQFSKGDADFWAIDTNTFAVDKKQREWLKSTLAQSRARWKLVYGHHPAYSTGGHGFWDWLEGGKLRKIRETLVPIMCENGVDMFIAGHDHHMEVNHSGCGIVHVISGASAKTRKVYGTLKKKRKNILKFSRGYKLGFAHVRLFQNSGTLKILGSSGELVYLYHFPNRD